MHVQTASSPLNHETDEQLRQQLLYLQQSHEGILKAVSHDLRAPLRHLTSFAPLLRESVQELANLEPHSEAAQEALEFLGTMEQSARKMSAMLDGLMLLSKAARQPLHVQPVNVKQVMLACAEQAPARVPTQQWVFPQEAPLVQGDPASVHAVLWALLDNAIKFSSTQVVPSVQVTVTQPKPSWWRIEIADNGVGVDTSRMSSMGAPFQRLHRESDFAGVGCGLAQAHVLLQRHGAQLELVSAPGAGCVARVDWPAA